MMQVCEMLRSGKASYVWDEEMKVPYMVMGDQWIGFDDERAIRIKMDWLKRNNFGGAMVWTVDLDDFTGTTCGNDVKYPLIGAMREELLGIPRPGNDVDWAKEVPTLTLEVTTIPSAIPISLTDILNKVTKKPSSSLVLPTSSVTPEGSNAKVVCYYASWSGRRPGLGRFTPEDVDGQLCTHLVYAFGALKDNRLALKADKQPGDSDDSDEEGDTGGDQPDVHGRLQTLREKNPDLKIILAIGGWAFGSAPFKELTTSSFRMNQFVYDSTEFLRSNNFDGLDIDWEYPRFEFKFEI